MTMKRQITFFVLAILAAMLCMPAARAQVSDSIWPVPSGACPGSATAGVGVVYNGIPAVGTGEMVLTTPFAPVYQVQTTAAASTVTFTCELICPSRTAAGKGCTVFGFAFYYGVQTTAATSENAPVCGTVTFPVPAAAETPSTVAFVSAPVTAQPVIGSANLGLTTAGAFVTQYVNFTTPLALNGPYQKAFCTFSFGQTAAAAQVINTPGGTIFGVNTVF